MTDVDNILRAEQEQAKLAAIVESTGVAGIRPVEARALPGAVPPLMERAGAAAAALALRLLDGPGSVLVACGPGNNGGDGFVVARHLKAAGLRVAVALAGDAARLPADASAAHAAWLEQGSGISADLPPPPPGGWSLVVDALFGIGLQRPLEDRYAGWIASLNAQPCPRLALDIPSGLDADTGRRLGPCFAATHTVSFIALKPTKLILVLVMLKGLKSIFPPSPPNAASPPFYRLMMI